MIVGSYICIFIQWPGVLDKTDCHNITDILLKVVLSSNCHKIYISKTLTLIKNANLGLNSSESDDYVSRCLIKPT